MALTAPTSLSAQVMPDTESSQTPAAQGKSPGEETAAQPLSGYDPLNIYKDEVETIELTVADARRSREIPLLVYLPRSPLPAAVIIHSHGLGGTRNTSPFLGKHWAARGYVAVFVQHPGSDDGVWQDTPKLQRLRALRQSASGENLTLRTGDVTAVLDQMEKWNVKKSHQLTGRMDLEHIGMSGHSFGAVTTQHVGGQSTFGKQRSTDRRISAAIPMSPSFPRVGGDRAFEKVVIPWLCMTGTRDVQKLVAPTWNHDWRSIPRCPTATSFSWSCSRAEHSVFTEQSLLGNRKAWNPKHHNAIKAITTAFWDAYLRDDAAAKAWLTTDAVRSVLETQDRWQTK